MLIYGRNTVSEALKSNLNIDYLLFQDTLKNEGKVGEMTKLAKSRKILVKYFSGKKLSNELRSDDHQGVGAKVSFSPSKLIDVLNERGGEGSFICIPEATYEHNVGAIIRTAECAGLAGVIINPKIAVTPTIAKTSTGALFHIPIIKESVFQAIKTLKKESYKIVGIERGGNSIYQEDLSGNVLYIIGGEDKSLTEPIIKNCDFLITLPQAGSVNSLNMSVAAAIAIYEGLRQNTK